jgi:hypothetical protein
MAITDFMDAMRARGLMPPGTIISGEFQRFPGVGHERNRADRAGWCKLFADGKAGIFGDWRQGFTQTWIAQGADKQLSKPERQRLRQEIGAAQRKATQAAELLHIDNAENARAIWQASLPAPADHPYLVTKGIEPHLARLDVPWHTTKKNGRRYRYYIPQRDAKEHAGASGLPRLPAAELESAVLDQLRAILRTPELVAEMLPQAIKLDPTLDEAKVTVAMTQLDAIWDQLFPAEQTRIVKLLVEKVIVSPNDLKVRLRANGFERLVLEMNPKSIEQQEEALA